tara:strand:+ start:6684 stop:7652 length:969 start_codon:yes stop_codon:yes gene_type:complete
MRKIFISTTTFGSISKSPLSLLKKNNINFHLNHKKIKLTSEETANFASDCDAIIAGTEDLTELVKSNSKLKLICRLGVGIENVPLELCKKLKITVCNTPNALRAPVAELSIAMMLSLNRNIQMHDREVRKNQWKKLIGNSIVNSNIGIVGFGSIGQYLLEILLNFLPNRINIFDPYVDHSVINKLAKSNKVTEIVNADFDTLIKDSDIISIHTPLTNETRDLFGKNEFSKMKKNSIIINTSRGGIVNEKELYSALKNRDIRGAGLDVFIDEPYKGKLIELDNILLTPHIASSTSEARASLELDCVNTIISYFQKKKLNNKII